MSHPLSIRAIVDRLLLPALSTPVGELGHYDPKTQTWSHRDSALMSPIKHNRES